MVKKLFNSLIILTLLSFISCNNIVQNREEKTVLDKITVKANIDFGNSSRKAVPDNYDFYKELTYKLVATCNTDNSFSKPEQEVDFNGIELELVAANWSFELTAYDAENTPILRSSENVNIDITEDTELSFKMVGIAKGNLVYEFDLKSEQIPDIENYKPSKLENYENPIFAFEVYKYNESVQTTLTGVPLVLNEDEYSNKLIDEYIPGSENGKIPNIYKYTRKISFTLDEGTYIVICKRAERNETLSEDTIKKDDMNFFFQEVVEIKAGLITKSKFNDKSSISSNYKITFHTNGGYFESGSVNKIQENELYEYVYSLILSYPEDNIGNEKSIPIPERKVGDDYYAFLGWYADSKLTKLATAAYGDFFNISDEASLAGNIELYAKWSEEPTENILQFSNNYIPVVSNNWNQSITTTDPGNLNNYIKVGNDTYSVYDEQIVYKNEDVLISEDNFDTDELICNFCYDEKTRCLLLITKDDTSDPENPDNPNRKRYLRKYDLTTEVLSSRIELGTISSEGILGGILHTAMAAYNNKIWITYYNPYDSNWADEFTNDVCEITLKADGTFDSLKQFTLRDFLGEHITDLNDFYYYTYITDFAFTESGELYATLRIGTGYKNISINENNVVLMGGELLIVDQEKYEATPVLKYNPSNTRTVTYITSSGYQYTYDYYGITSHRDVLSLAYPTKILAIKPDELVLVDEGAFMWVSDKNKGNVNEINRVVVFDLQKSSIKYVCPVRQDIVGFSGSYSDVGSSPSGFNSISNDPIFY